MGAEGRSNAEKRRIGSQAKRSEGLKRWRRRVWRWAYEGERGARGREEYTRKTGDVRERRKEREEVIERGKEREREDFENEKRSRGLRRALLFDSGRAAAENTNGRIMKMTPCDAAATLARRDSFEQ